MLLIAALLMGFMIPNLSALGARSLRQQAGRITATIDLGRQRAVMTGVRHRLWMDLESSRFRLEWSQVDPEALDSQAAVRDPALDPSAPLSLAPPLSLEQTFQPVPGLFGRDSRLEDDIEIVGLEAGAGWVQTGEAFVAFERDGSTDYTKIWLEDEDGNGVELTVLPLADTVRITDAPL